MLSDFKLVGKLGPEGHDDQHGQKRAEQASNVGESVIGFPEGPFHQDVLGGLSQVELHILVVPDIVVVDLS